MVKIYLRYSLKTTFGVVTSFPSNVIFDGTGKCAITGALEHVLIWDLKKGSKVACYSDSEVKKQPVVSQIVLSPDNVHLAAGCVPHIPFVQFGLQLCYATASSLGFHL